MINWGRAGRWIAWGDLETAVAGDTLMAAIVAVYKTPKSVDAFNAYYFAKHVPLAKTIPGLRRYRVSDGAVGCRSNPARCILSRSWSSTASRRSDKGLASPEGQATAGDLGNFADGGVDLMVFDTKEV